MVPLMVLIYRPFRGKFVAKPFRQAQGEIIVKATRQCFCVTKHRCVLLVAVPVAGAGSGATSKFRIFL
jgi:hypothetical protein